MNVWVDPSLISEVLLQDGWHIVVPGTFHPGKYAVVEGSTPPLVTPGFAFNEAGAGGIAGPMSSVLAVRHTMAAARTTEVKEPPAAKPEAAPAPPADEPRTRGWRDT